MTLLFCFGLVLGFFVFLHLEVGFGKSDRCVDSCDGDVVKKCELKSSLGDGRIVEGW